MFFFQNGLQVNIDCLRCAARKQSVFTFFFSCPHAAVQNRDTMTAFAHAVMRPCVQDYKAAPMPMPSCLTHPFHTGEGQNIFLSKKKVQISVLQCKTKTNIVGQWLIKKLLVLSFRRYQVSTRNLNMI